MIDGQEVRVYLDIGQPRESFLSTVGMGGDSNVIVFREGEERSIDPTGLRQAVTVALFGSNGRVQFVGELEPNGEPLVAPPEVTCRFALLAPNGSVDLEVGETIEIPDLTRKNLDVSQAIKGL